MAPYHGGGRRGTPIPPGTFKRAWVLTKMSFSVLRKDKEMLAYPILAGLIVVPFAILLFFFTIPPALSGEFGNPLPLLIVMMFVLSIVGTLVMTFFNVAMVASAMKRMDGENPTIGYSLSFAARRLKYVLMWGLFAGAIGFLLSLLNSNKSGGIRIIGFLAGASWGVAKYFALPVIAFNDLGPIKAVKESISILKKSWGTALIANLGIGLLFFMVIFIIIFLGPISLAFLGIAVGWEALVVGGIAILATILVVILIYSIVNVILITALYRYATTGKISEEFSQSFITNPFSNGPVMVEQGSQSTGTTDYDSQWNLRHQGGRT
jgi:hypothetical protein